jgi:hypothetical protein
MNFKDPTSNIPTIGVTDVLSIYNYSNCPLYTLYSIRFYLMRFYSIR